MKNKIQEGDVLNLTNGTGGALNSGDPIPVGEITGVCAVDIANGSQGAVHIKGVFDLKVEAVDNAGNSAVAIGDKLYYDSAATIKINKDVTNGVFFGYALEAISAGENDTINVLLK